MPELLPNEMDALTQSLAALPAAFAAAVEETLHTACAVDGPTIEQIPAAALMADPGPWVQVVFSMPGVGVDESILALSPAGAAALLAQAGIATDGAAEIDESALAAAAPLFDALLAAVGRAAAAGLGRPAAPEAAGPVRCEALLLPAGFMMDPAVVRAAFTLGGQADHLLSVLLTPAAARALAGIAGAPADNAGGGLSDVDFSSVLSPTMDPLHAFQPFDGMGATADSIPRGMDLILDIPLDVTVELGRAQMLIKDVLDLATGSIVELDRVAGEPIDLLVNGQLIAKGEVVVIEDNFGIRITEIISPADRLQSMGKRAA